jgi:uncharacterized membrane protein YkoI
VVLIAMGCSGDSTEDPPAALPTAEDAEAAAIAVVGGTGAEDAAQVSEDGYDLWEVEVSMDNGAMVEVVLFVDSGELFEVKDTVGPFDYDTLDPLPGQLTYSEARDIAFATVEGEQVAWEVKYDGGPYFYEFYVLQVGDQLWEIKLWSDSGEVFVTEAKDEID